MKGIAATIWRLLYVSRLQRWLAGCGFTALLVALGALSLGRRQAAHSLIGLAGVLGITLVVVAPVVAGPILFGAMAAPRTLALIPHGRLQLLLGAVCSQLLLALFLAAGLGAMGAAPAPVVLVIAFGFLTVFFLGLSWSMYYRPAFLFWLPLLVLPRLAGSEFPQLHLGARLVTPSGLAVVLTASVLAWLGYGLCFLRLRRVILPAFNAVGLGSMAQASRSGDRAPSAPLTYTPRDAMRVLLTGNAKIRRGIIMVVLLFGAVAVLLTLVTAGAPQPGGNPAYVFALFICFMAALVPGVFAGMMALRARRLWLTAGKGRAELFSAIESQSWRYLFFAIGTALLMAVPLVALSNHSAPALNILVAMAALPLSCGSTLVYASLLYIRGNRLPDILIYWASTFFLVVVACAAAVDSHAFPALIGVQIILVPLLRQVARGRWNRIDWLLLRQPLSKARLI